MRFTPQEDSRVSLALKYVSSELPDVGDTVTYEQLVDICGITMPGDDVPISTLVAGIVSKVNERLHRDGDWRWLINLPLVGYRVATPAEQREEAQGRLRAAQRQQLTSLRVTESLVRHPEATPGERKRAADAAASIAALHQMQERERRRINRRWPKEEVSPVIKGELLEVDA